MSGLALGAGGACLPLFRAGLGRGPGDRAGFGLGFRGWLFGRRGQPLFESHLVAVVERVRNLGIDDVIVLRADFDHFEPSGLAVSLVLDEVAHLGRGNVRLPALVGGIPVAAEHLSFELEIGGKIDFSRRLRIGKVGHLAGELTSTIRVSFFWGEMRTDLVVMSTTFPFCRNRLPVTGS